MINRTAIRMKIRNISALPATLLALFLTGLSNSLIFIFQTNGTAVTNAGGSGFPVSSRVIGSVWTFLILCLTFSFSRVIKKNQTLAIWIFGLFLVCIFYPAYTIGFSLLPVMIAGNLLTIALASFISGALFTSYKIESLLTFFITLWVIFVSYLMFYHLKS